MDISSYLISRPARRATSWLAGLALVVALVGTGSASAPNGPLRQLPPERSVLLNGLRVVSVQQSGGRVAVVCAVRAGAMFDPAGKSGLANITAGLLTRGAGSYSGDRIQDELSDAGAKIDVRTDWDATWIEGEGPAASLPVLMDVMSLMVTAPRFAAEDVEAVKRVAAERVRADAADPRARASRAFAHALYGSHTYGRAIWGDEASIVSISPGDVTVFYNRFYAANAAVLGVCAPVVPDDVSALARTRFGRWTKKKIVPATFLPPAAASGTRVIVVDTPGASEAVVRAGFMAPGRSGSNPAPVKVIAERLQQDLQGRLAGASTIAVAHDLRTLQSPFVVSYTVPIAGLEASLRGVSEGIEAFHRMAAPAEGTTARIYFTRVTDTCGEEARTLASADFFAGQKLAADPANYRVDEAQIAATARAVLKPAAMTIVVVGDAAEIRRALKGKFPVEVAASS